MTTYSYETAVQINAPVEKIYSYVADLPRHVEWNEQPAEMTSMNGDEVAVGSRYRTIEVDPSNLPWHQRIMMKLMMPMMMKKWDLDERATIAEITALEPRERVAWNAHMPNNQGKKLMEMDWEILFAEKNGGTEVIQRCEIKPPADSPFLSMLNDAQVAKNKEETALNLNRLKSMMEI